MSATFCNTDIFDKPTKRAYLLSPHFKENRIHSLQKNVKTRGIDNSKNILYIDNAIIDR